MTCIVVNNSAHVSDQDVVTACAAAQAWARKVAVAWDAAWPAVRWMSPAQFAANRSAATFGVIWLQDGLDVQGAAGYHDVEAMRPVGKVDVAGTIAAGMSWTVTLTHELGELILDPWCVAESRYDTDSTIAYEICDPPESDQFAILVNGIKCSDYLLPSYFAGGPGPYDAGHHLTGPAPTLLPGGYASVCVGGKWSQITPNGEELPAKAVQSAINGRHALRLAMLAAKAA